MAVGVVDRENDRKEAMIVRVLLVALAVIVVDLIVRLALRRPAPESAPRDADRFRWLRVAVNVIGLASLALVASTASVANEGSLTGNRLIWHVGSGPVFAVGAVAIALSWAHRNRFSSGDVNGLRSAGGWAPLLRKFFFWLAVLLAVPTLVSILAAMFPYFGTEDQQKLLRIHRYCGPLLAGAGLLFGYFAAVTWRVTWREGSPD